MTESGFMKEFWRESIKGLSLSLWLGAAIFFSLAVAQIAFSVLPSGEMAGAVVNKTLEVINYSGLIIGLALIVLSFLSAERRWIIWVERILLAILVLACGLGQFVIVTGMRALSQQSGKPISELAEDDPLRRAYMELHGYSVSLLSVAMIAAFIAYFLVIKRSHRVNE